MNNNLIYNDVLNNISDIISLSSEERFNELISMLDNDNIIVTSNLIHKKKYITHKEQFIFNLDNYITFIKNNLFINQFDIRYIVNLTLYSKYNKILFDKEYYYSNIEKYTKKFKNLFMYNYKRNVSLLKKYTNIKERDFDDLVSHINTIKKKSYVYFEDINVNNMNFYLEIINYLENIN